MKILVYLISFSILGFSSSATVQADAHGGVHVRIPNCEEDDDCPQKIPEVCMELKPWYHNQHFDQYEYIEDQADRLQDDTSWPGQREDFSDYLMR